jgi:hypothetical protein
LVAGKITDALSENLKVTQTLCGSEIPPCSPLARRSCKELSAFGIGEFAASSQILLAAFNAFSLNFSPADPDCLSRLKL